MKAGSRPLSTSKGVLCVGLATLDVIQLVERLPTANQKVVAQDFLLAAGGPAANAAVAAAWCGAPTALATALPDHALSQVVLDDLQACGVSVTVAARYDGPPVTASIMVTRGTGERAVVSPTALASEVTGIGALPSLDRVGAILMDGYFPALSLPLAKLARERGISVVLDAGSFKPHTADAVRAADCVVASGDFSPPGTDGSPDAVFAHLADLGVTWAAITRGERPVLYRTPSGGGEVAVSPVVAVDSLGAGDFFHGALLAALADHGLDEDSFARDLEYACTVAGASLKSFGTRAWLKEQ